MGNDPRHHRPDDDGQSDEAPGVDTGRDAEMPQQIPAKGWKSVLFRTKQQVKEDNVTILAAGVAFYLLLALAPAMVAVLAIYGLVADPAEVAKDIDQFGATLPADARELLTDQLQSAATSSDGKLGFGLLIGLVAAVLGASKGARSMIEAVNVAFDEDETRGFVRLRLLALAFTLGFIVVMLVALGAMTLLPAIGDQLGDGGRLAASVLRWPVLTLVALVALAAIYRYAPARDEPRWRWVTPGALVAAVLWLIGSALFTLYADHFGSFGKTYGTLGAVVVLMLWLFLTAAVVLVGAEVNAEAERQTRRDTTDGPSQPLGQRQAYAADTVGPDAPPKRDGQAERDEEERQPTGSPNPS